MNTNGSPIQKGFFKRLISYITTKNYERKKLANEKYKLNWDQIKWRYRIGKFFFLFGFYYTGKFLFVDRIANNLFQREEIEKDRMQIENFLKRGMDQEELDYNKILEQIRSTYANFFKIDLIENINENVLHNDKEIFTIYTTIEKLVEKYKQIDKSGNEQFDNFDLKSCLKILKIKKKYDIENLDPEYEHVVNFAQSNYKFFITGSFIPKKILQYSTNILEEFSTIDEVAFVIALNLFDFTNANSVNEKIQKEIISLIDKAIQIDKKNLIMCFNEDLKMLKKDLLAEKNILTFVLSNPLFQINFPKELSQSIQNLKMMSEENYYKKISFCLELLKATGYEIKNLNRFKFDKVNYLIFGISDDGNVIKNKFEKYLKLKTSQIEEESTQTIKSNVNQRKNSIIKNNSEN